MMPPEKSIRFAVTQIAADWLIAHRAGSLSQTRRQEFLSWLKASPVHLEEYLGVAALERALPEAAKAPPISLADLIEMADDDQDTRIVELNPMASGARFRLARLGTTRRFWWGIGALVSLSVAGFFMIWALRMGVLEIPLFGHPKSDIASDRLGPPPKRD
jgi:transmembrane sensor